jgi:hypothetical protein
MKKRLLIVLGLGLMVLIAATALYYMRPGTLYSSAPRAIQKNAAFWTPQEVPVWTLVRAQELIYDLSYSGSAQFPGQSDALFQVQLQGSLHLLVLSEETDGYRVWMSVRPEGAPQLSSVPSPLRSTLIKGWMEGVGARLGTRGFVIEPQLPADMDATLTQFWRSLSERMRVTVPSLLNTPSWEQQENMNGLSVAAQYEIDPTLRSPALLSEKIYIQKSFEESSSPAKKIMGESLILLRPHFEGLEQLQADARETQELNGQSWTSDSSLKLQWQKQNMQSETRVSQLESRWGENTGETGSSQEASIQKAALGGLGLDELWDQMHQPGTQSSQGLYLKLKAWIYLHPAEIHRLVERLKVLDESDPALKMGIRALAAAGQAEAQNALVDLLEHRQSDATLARKIITTLGLVPAPTIKAQETLEQLSAAREDSPVRRSSRLALGMMGQRLSQSQDPDSQKRAVHLEALALDNLRAAQSLAATIEALAVLGNCGITRFEDLQPWLTHPDPAIRGQAWFALRFARPLTTADYLVEQYAVEASAEVRRQIMQAISLRSPDEAWFQGLRKLMTRNLPDEDKIILAKSLVGTVRKYRETALNLLTQLLEQTQDAAVRESLARYQDTARRQIAL